MAQLLVPVAPDIDTSGWAILVGPAAWQDLDEGYAGHDSNTTRLQTGLGPTNEDFEVTLAAGTDPVSSTGHILKVVTQISAAGSIDYTVELKQGGVVKATMTFTETSTTYVGHTYTLSGAEADSISDYTALSVRVNANGATVRARITAIEFEIPDAGAATPSWTGPRKGQRIAAMMMMDAA